MAQKAIALYSEMRSLTMQLAASDDIDQVKDIANRSEALIHYAQLADDPEMESKISEIRVRAQRRLGELSAALPKTSGSNLPNVAAPRHPGKREVLKQAGLSKDVAHRCEKLAQVPEAQFEAFVAHKRAALLPISGADLVKSHVSDLRKQAVVTRADEPDLLVASDLKELAERGLKFGTIYADPPWLYDNQSTRGATSNHYGGMPVEAISALPIADLAAENAHLHLWTTNGFLADALTVMKRWGFEFKSCYVWVKPRIGLGNYWRVSHEFMLLGVRGSCPFQDKALKSWGEFDTRAHSAKPEEVRALVERASPGPRLELFGRKTVPGWVVWGNEVGRQAFNDEVAQVVA